MYIYIYEIISNYIYLYPYPYYTYIIYKISSQLPLIIYNIYKIESEIHIISMYIYTQLQFVNHLPSIPSSAAKATGVLLLLEVSLGTKAMARCGGQPHLWPWLLLVINGYFLVGGLEHLFFSIIYGMSSFPLTFIFFKMVIAPPTSFMLMIIWDYGWYYIPNSIIRMSEINGY